MYDYYFIKQSTLFSQGYIFTHATKKTQITFIPLSSIADNRFFSDVAEIALDRECIVDQAKINHPAYLDLYDHLLFEPDFQKLLANVKMFPFYRRNQKIITHFTPNQLSDECRLLFEDVNKILTQVKDPRLFSIIEMAKASLYDQVIQQILHRILAEDLKCNSILGELLRETKKRYTNWQLISMNLPKNVDLANTELIMDEIKIEYYNDLAISFYQIMLQYVEFMQQPDLANKRRKYGEWMVDLNEIINQNIPSFESINLNMSLRGQMIARFIENCLSSQKKGVILMDGLSGPGLEIVLQQRGLQKIGKIDPIPILEFK